MVRTGKITTVICYSPANESEEEDKDDFYTLLSSKLSSVPPRDYLVLLGDMKASISNESGLWNFAVGPVTVDNLNDNRERMSNFLSCPQFYRCTHMASET